MKNKKFTLTTPVLYLIFNRLNTVKQTFPEIKKAKPKQLFIAADGPRTKEEERKTDSVRKYVISNIDWPCKVKKLFRRKNLGCKYAVSGAIDWFFYNVEQGIILEDDCLPSQSFFRFCQEMLEKYKDDSRIMQISGTNIEGKSGRSNSYFYSKMFNVWGWATWKRAWKLYDVEMELWGKINKMKFINNLNYNYFDKIRTIRIMNKTYNNQINTWDYQWGFACTINNGLCIIPKVNLITNLGFKGEATHTNNYNAKNKMLKRKEVDFPLKENKERSNNFLYQKKYSKYFKKGMFLRKIKKLFNLK